MVNNSESESRVESNPRRRTDPYDQELDSAGNLDNPPLRVNPSPGRESPQG
jgi:hypothetical protein